MSNLRVTAGRYKGRTIKVPKGDLEIRPAMDMMRESVFSILGALEGKSFLDLFSGSGIIGLEAASRGADPVACVERDRAKFPQLLENVGIAETRIDCHCMPVERFLLRNKSQWAVIFCDPPFPYQYKGELLHSIGRQKLLLDHGVVVIHYPERDCLPETTEGLCVVDERKYGHSMVRFYKKDDQNRNAIDSLPPQEYTL